MTGCCVAGDELVGYMRRGEILDQLCDCYASATEVSEVRVCLDRKNHSLLSKQTIAR
jgi:hypothetical protein